MKYETILKSVLAFVGGSVSYLYGGWSALLQILLVFVCLDYITGVFAAGFNGQLSSKVGLKGIAKKVMVFALVAVAHMVDTALGGKSLFRDATIFFYIANELISILENAGSLGVPLPPMLTKAVEILKGKGETNV